MPTAEHTSELDRDYSVTVLVPPSKPRTPNETSLLIIGRDRVKNSAFLITGDVPAGMLPQMLAQLPNHVDVLQAPHHGADPGLLQLISHTDPDYVVISASRSPRNSLQPRQRSSMPLARSASAPVWSTPALPASPARSSGLLRHRSGRRRRRRSSPLN